MKSLIKNYFPRLYRLIYILIRRKKPKKIHSNHYHFPVQYLRSLDARLFSDIRYVESDLLIRLGLNSDAVNMPISHLPYRGGLELWQLPCQLAPFIAEIIKHNVSSYLEIGINKGGVFILMNEVLEKTSPKFTYSLGLDTLDVPVIRDYCFANPKANFKKIDSHTYAFRQYLQRRDIQHFDLVFIDGDHSYEGVAKDFHFAMKYNARLIAFHDIHEPSCPGVIKLWAEILEGYNDEFIIKEYDAQAEDSSTSMGIGLMIRR